MKPLDASQITDFLKRFDNFQESEIRSLELVSPTEIEVTLTAQDNARAFDWITVKLYFTAVEDAKLIDNKKLNFIDMSEGITLLYKSNNFYFAINSLSTISSIKQSLLYIMCKSVKYSEGKF